jgi:hypothetical protein
MVYFRVITYDKLAQFKGGEMFGQNQNQHQDDALIPDQAIEGALAADAASADAPAPATDWQHPGAPLDTPAASDDSSTPTEPTATPDAQPPTVAAPVSNELQEIKQKALSELAPLVDHLEQTPEEKFRTTMMMIQASDDQSLLHVAYESALKIEDEKTKAQALLDVINEINYFTQHATSPQA